MNLSELNKWLDDAEKARFFLPASEVAEDTDGIIEDALERIRSYTLSNVYGFQRILDLQGVVRTLLRNFEIFI